jgi:thymidylate synthase (FAD)
VKKRQVEEEEPGKVLDHGYVRLIEHWGSDQRIVEAARMSTQKGFLGWGQTWYVCEGCGFRMSEESWRAAQEPGFCPEAPTVPNHKALRTLEKREDAGDERLLKYLWINQHFSPFELAGAVFEVQAPIFVFRQWHRHRTQSYNEHSARYGPLPDLDYRPTVPRLMQGGGANKQAKSSKAVTLEAAGAWLDKLGALHELAQFTYQAGLDADIPSELARLATTCARYSRMRCQATLRNWLHFVELRSDAHAQWEIRQFSDALWAQLEVLFPRTLDLFREHTRLTR